MIPSPNIFVTYTVSKLHGIQFQDCTGCEIAPNRPSYKMVGNIFDLQLPTRFVPASHSYRRD